MNTIGWILFLISSFGAAIALVFLGMGIIIENMRSTILKSLASLITLGLICAGSLWLCNETMPYERAGSKEASLSEEMSVPEAEMAEQGRAEQPGSPEQSHAGQQGAPEQSQTEQLGLPEQSQTGQPGSPEQSQAGQPGSPEQSRSGQQGAAEQALPKEGKTDGETIQPEDPGQDLHSENAELQIHYLDVGQGDCTLIMCEGKAMLIDAGDDSKGTAIQAYLQKRGINRLEYVIVTHPDADHIGGMDVIFTKFDCGQIIMPEVEKDTKAYKHMIEAMDYKRYVSTVPVVGESYSLGSAVFTILSPGRRYEDSNNNSVGIRLTYGEKAFLFLGDAQQEAENDMLQSGLELSADVIKIAHHGSKYSSSSDFIKAVEPTYAVISCGEDNSYGHPSAEVLNTLREEGIQVYRTDEQGTITVTSDGRTITFNCAPSESWKAGEA